MAKEKDYIPGSPPGSQGPTFENFDAAYELDQRQKLATESDRANLVDINRQIAATDKELARLAGRVVPAQGRSAQSVAKSANYESKVIDTKRFLESEKEAITKILEEKKEMLPQSYSSAVEEKNIARKTIQGPPVINKVPDVKPPKYTAIVDPKGAAIMGTEPAPPKELPNPKATPVGKIYIKDKVMQYPEMNIGITTDAKGNRVPIKGTGPAREYVAERMPMSDKEVIQKYEKMGADYQAKLAEEAITHEKLEFDFEKGEARIVGNDNFIRVEGQEMFARTSGRKNQVVVPSTKANEAIDRRFNTTPQITSSQRWEDVQREKAQRAKAPSTQKFIGDKSGIVPNENARTYGVSDEAKRNMDFKISSAAKAAAASKIAQAAKKLGGKTNMLNIPIMTKGSADKIFKDFFGKQDYSS
jgi:hypothetical protein